MGEKEIQSLKTRIETKNVVLDFCPLEYFYLIVEFFLKVFKLDEIINQLCAMLNIYPVHRLIVKSFQ